MMIYVVENDGYDSCFESVKQKRWISPKSLTPCQETTLTKGLNWRLRSDNMLCSLTEPNINKLHLHEIRWTKSYTIADIDKLKAT